jgi:hypothetical protein
LETTTVLVADPRRWRALLVQHQVLGAGWTVPSYEGIEDVLAGLEWAAVASR